MRGVQTCVRTYVRSQMVRPRERPHADLAAERFLTGVNAKVPGQLVRPREPPVAIASGATVRSLAGRRLTLASGDVFTRLHRKQDTGRGHRSGGG